MKLEDLDANKDRIAQHARNNQTEWNRISKLFDAGIDYNKETVDIYIVMAMMNYLESTNEIVIEGLEHINNLTNKIIELQRDINGYQNTLLLLRANAHTQN